MIFKTLLLGMFVAEILCPLKGLLPWERCELQRFSMAKLATLLLSASLAAGIYLLL